MKFVLILLIAGCAGYTYANTIVTSPEDVVEAIGLFQALAIDYMTPTAFSCPEADGEKLKEETYKAIQCVKNIRSNSSFCDTFVNHFKPCVQGIQEETKKCNDTDGIVLKNFILDSVIEEAKYLCGLDGEHIFGLSKKKYLLLNAVPSLILPHSSHEVCSRKRRQPKSRTENNGTIEVADNVSNLFEVDEISSNFKCGTSEREGTDRIMAAEASVQLQDSILKTKCGVDCATRVKSGDLLESFSTRITSSKELTTVTGLPSFELLNTIVELVTEMFPKNRKKRTVMTVKDEIIFTLMKLKTALRYNVLSILFSVSEPSCRVIFHETSVKLAKVLQHAITWPSEEEILCKIPLCFKGFDKVKVVLDCTEIPLHKLNNVTGIINL